MQNRSGPNYRPSLDEQSGLVEHKSLRSTIGHNRNSAGTQPADGPTILVADDSDDTRQMLRTLLGMKGYRVIEASDGEQAVQATQHGTPDLVLLDLGLPRLNGLNVIRRLRKELNLTEVPVVVVTGYDGHFETAMAAGSDDYLLKPIDFDRLDEILDYYAPTLRATPAAQHS
jgi:CheY-like chemotaxis protein